MARPTNWAPLLLLQDPVPGCPDTVERGARDYGLTGTRLQESSTALRGLRQRSATCSLAVDAVLRQAEDLSGTVQRLSERYQGTSQALLGYVPELRRAQHDSLTILQDAKACVGDITRSTVHVGEATVRVSGSLDDPVHAAQATSDLLAANRELMRHQAHLAQLKIRITTVTHARDQAAATAARQIETAIEHSGIKDTLWDKITNLVDTINKALAAIATFVTEVLDELIRQIANRIHSGYVAAKRFLETLSEMIIEGQIDTVGEAVMAALLLATLAEGVRVNVLTGKDHTIGARDAYALSSGPANKWKPVPPGSSNQSKATSMGALMRQYDDLGSPPAVRVIKNPGPPETYTVIIPGTSDWFPGGDEVTDLESNAQLRLDLESSAEAAVKAAMARARVPEGAQVMLVGHSQGGMTAVSLANDSEFAGKYHVDRILAFASPINDKAVPPHTQVLSIANVADVIPALDGQVGTYSSAPNVTHVNFFDHRPEINPLDTIGNNHHQDLYAEHVEGMADNEAITSFVDGASRFMPSDDSTAIDVQVRAR